MLDLFDLPIKNPCEFLTEVSEVHAGSELWPEVMPDNYKAYVEYEICTSLPNIIGPEMHGRVIGYHPQVLANSYRSLLHQQNNIGHSMKVYGATRDRIVGTVVGVAFPEMTEAWVMPESLATAPKIKVLAVVHKAAEGVEKLLGKHLTSREKMSVSIESTCLTRDYSVFDPSDESFINLLSAPEKFGKDIMWFDKKRGLQIKKFEGRQLVLCPGGESGVVEFMGVGFTPTPAEKIAQITDIRAQIGDGMMMVAAMAALEWDAGDEVCWSPIIAGLDAGRGTVLEVIHEGEVWSHGRHLKATAIHPLLRVKVLGKKLEIIRTTASLKKIIKKN